MAEALKLYGNQFWSCLPLGLPVAVASVLAFELSIRQQTAVFVVLAPFFTLAIAEACTIEAGRRPPLRAWVTATVLGTLAFLPAAATLPWIVIAAVLWLGLVGWVVPVALLEELPPGPAIRRSLALGRADFAHAAGGIATLFLLFFVTRVMLAWLLREQADNTVRASVFLADVLISPVVFLGVAVLYRDLVARVGTTRTDRLRARAEALAEPAE